MEVHHHPHVPTHSKPWKEYLIEGLMIFVAVTLGYGAENIREHNVNKHKAIISLQDLYKDLKQDSILYVKGLKRRNLQDASFEIISNLYDEKKVLNNVPSIYAAQSLISLRVMPIMNTMALDQIKSSGILNYIENDELKQIIQSYASDGNGLKLREQREFSFLDRMLDPITTTRFEYKFYQKLGEGNNPISEMNDNIEIIDRKFYIRIKIPEDLKIINVNTLDWNNYLSILGMIRTIRKSTDRNYIIPTQAKCNKLIDLVRKYLEENNALID